MSALSATRVEPDTCCILHVCIVGDKSRVTSIKILRIFVPTFYVSIEMSSLVLLKQQQTVKKRQWELEKKNEQNVYTFFLLFPLTVQRFCGCEVPSLTVRVKMNLVPLKGVNNFKNKINKNMTNNKDLFIYMHCLRR